MKQDVKEAITMISAYNLNVEQFDEVYLKTDEEFNYEDYTILPVSPKTYEYLHKQGKFPILIGTKWQVFKITGDPNSIYYLSQEEWDHLESIDQIPCVAHNFKHADFTD